MESPVYVTWIGFKLGVEKKCFGESGNVSTGKSEWSEVNHAKKKSLIMKACERVCCLCGDFCTGSERPVFYQFYFADRFNKHDMCL